VCFGPLNVQLPTLVGTPLARRFDQRAINEAYVAEQRRIGPRPAVSWQEPVWLEHDLDGGRSDPRRASSVPRPEHEPEPEERNAATIRRLVETFDDGTFPLIALEVLSPHIVGHDLTGRLSDPAHPDSGQFVDLVGVAAGALDDARFELRSIEAEGDEVHAHIVARGRATGTLLGWDGDGSEVTLETRTTYRFDRNGLIVELWQHAVSLPAPCG
jgi:predicted ester cyclase